MSPLRLVIARRIGPWSIAIVLAWIGSAATIDALASASSRVLTRVLPASTTSSQTSSISESRPPRLVRVELTGAVTPEALMAARLDVIEVHRGSYCLILELPGDGAALAALGATWEVLDENPGRTAAERARVELPSRLRPAGKQVWSATDRSGRFSLQTLPPLGSGSLAGFWTLDEVKMKLDDLVASDVNDVVADKLDTIGYSVQGRPIWGLCLGKTVPYPDNRPVAFYNALTHAREPEGMQALIYFVDDILSKYGTDPTATYLLDHRRLYIVPVVNPDGYRFNQTFYDSTGIHAYHRKNLRDTNGNGVSDYQTDGVDVNRNYSYQWGQPGASFDPADMTYCGPGPFSEPETQAQRDIVAQLQPKAGLSFHTYGDLLIHPWGWETNAAIDSLKFYEWSDDMSLGSGYQSGQAPRILYQVSGEFSDWCWGDEATKPAFPAWTPEVGTPLDMFWPQPSRIVPLAKQTLRPCYYVASIAGPYARIESSSLLEGSLNRGGIAHLSLRARNKGTNGLAGVPRDFGPELTATLSSLSAGANVLQPTIFLPAIGPLESGDPIDDGNFVISADDTVTLGRILRFQVDFTAPSGFFSRDTVEVYCGTPTVILSDDASNGMGNWSTGHSAWGVESDDVYQPGAFFADSPTGSQTYSDRCDASMMTATTLDLSRGVHAYLLFNGRWEFETDLDCGTVEANVGGNTWTPLPGISTSLGVSSSSSKQPLGLPVYDGARRLWRKERVDLSSFAGPGSTAVKIRFRVQSSSSPVFDGFRLDDIQVLTFDPAAQPAPVAVGDGPTPTALALAPPSPNPARAPTHLDFALPRGERVRLEVLDLQGRRVRSLVNQTLPAGRFAFGWDLRDEGGRAVAPGVYMIRLAAGEHSLVRPMVVLH